MEQLQDIIAVASGNRSLSIAIEPVSLALLFLAVFAAMLAALIIVQLLFA